MARAFSEDKNEFLRLEGFNDHKDTSPCLNAEIVPWVGCIVENSSLRVMLLHFLQ